MLRLRELRRTKKVSQQTLASFLGVTQATLSGWENEKYEIDNKSLTKLAELFDVSVDYLLGRETAENKNTPAEKAGVTDDDIKFALFEGSDNITDEMYDDVKAYAKFIKERKKNESNSSI